MPMADTRLKEAQQMAADVTAALGGSGIWGVEFFIGKDCVYFSELSPRPHDGDGYLRKHSKLLRV